LLIICYEGGQIQEVKMGRACVMMGRRDVHAEFVVKPEGPKYLDETGVDERWVLKRILEDMDWICLDQDKDGWWTVVSKVMNLLVL
jgi:hypothetical protein